MTDPTELTREFHEFFKRPVRDQATLVTGDELRLRRTLIAEEYDELDYEFALETEGDLRQQYKEAADLVYVIYGWDQHAGNLLSRVLEEVHRSNMTKLWPCDFCDGTGTATTGCMYRETPPYTPMAAVVMRCAMCNGTGKVAKYREDGKVLKPPTYEPPDLSFIPEEPPHAE